MAAEWLRASPLSQTLSSRLSLRAEDVPVSALLADLAHL